jgi:hypothetical protein
MGGKRPRYVPGHAGQVRLSAILTERGRVCGDAMARQQDLVLARNIRNGAFFGVVSVD